VPSAKLESKIPPRARTVTPRAPGRRRAGLARDAAAAICFLGATGLTAGVAIRIQVASFSTIPYWDFWDELRSVEDAFDGKLGLQELVAQHNEHRILLSRLQFIADYMFFGGRSVFLQATIFASFALLALALAWPAARVWNGRAVGLGFYAVALAAVLSPLGLDNLTAPFQIGFVQVYAFSVAAIALAACWLRSERDPPGGLHVPALAAIVVLGAAATYSMANGLVAWPVVLAVMVCRRAGPRSIAVVALAGIAFVTAYLWGYEPVRGHSPYGWSIRHPLELARYVLAFLGHPALALGLTAEQVVGGAGVALLACVLAVGFRSGALRESRALLFGSAVGVFVLATAGESALGRLSFGVEQALASRYTIGASVFWIGVAVGAAPLVARHTSVSLTLGARRTDVTGIAYVALGLAAWLSVNLASSPSDEALRAIQTRGESMIAAFVSGVQDDEATKASFPDPHGIVTKLAWLRTERLGPWDGGPGSELEGASRRVPRPDALEPCTGRVESVTPVTAGERLSGWIASPSGARASRALDVVGPDGFSEGVGLVDVDRPDVEAEGASRSSRVGFVAYARGTPARIVLLGAGSNVALCALQVT